MELASENVVITANQLNPSIFNHLWLAKNLTVEETDFTAPVLITPAIVQIETKQFSLLVTPDRLQFTPRGGEAQKSQAVKATVGHIVTALPHTPYTSAGINFNWHFSPDRLGMEKLSRVLFLNERCPLAGEFSTPDSLYGAYFSKNFFGFRLKLTILPVLLDQGNGPIDRISCNFNYHLYIARDGSIQQMNSLLDHWTAGKEYSRKLVEMLEGVDAIPI
jgi:hypothetical protein